MTLTRRFRRLLNRLRGVPIVLACVTAAVTGCAVSGPAPEDTAEVKEILVPGLACVRISGTPGEFSVGLSNLSLVTIEGSCISFEASEKDGEQTAGGLGHLYYTGDVEIHEGLFGACACPEIH